MTPEEEDLDDEHLLECIVDWRPDIIAAIRRAILSEPHMLWQFVLSPEGEEPLDLLTEMTAEIRRHSSDWIDRFAHGAGWDRIASRRIFILLKRPLPYSPSWIRAAETLLEDHFYWQNEKAPPFTVNRFHAMNVVGYEFLALVRVDSPCSSLS